jgi:hypothetical protein
MTMTSSVALILLATIDSGSSQETTTMDGRFKNSCKRTIVYLESPKVAKSLNVGSSARYYSSGSYYQDRLRQGCRSRAYKDVLTACLDNSFRSYTADIS